MVNITIKIPTLKLFNYPREELRLILNDQKFLEEENILNEYNN
jgi:hypothetical protein